MRKPLVGYLRALNIAARPRRKAAITFFNLLIKICFR